MPQPGGRAAALHRRHGMVRQVLHEHATSLSAAGHANRSRHLNKCAKDSGHYPLRSRGFNSELPATKTARVTVIPICESHLSLPQTEELCRRFLEAINKASLSSPHDNDAVASRTLPTDSAALNAIILAVWQRYSAISHYRRGVFGNHFAYFLPQIGVASRARSYFA
jgi:hypothetical protein